ncbi:MAG: hypothetical protein ACQESA_02330, partial [Patescibacteria group bacterium]
MEEERNLTCQIQRFIEEYKVDCQEIFQNHELPDQSIFIDILKENGAYWMHNGDLSDAHPGVSGGHCSEGEIDCSLVLNKPLLSEFLAMQLKLKLTEVTKAKTGKELRVDRVVTSGYEGITFAHDV